MNINNTLKNDEYITIPRIKKFCKDNNLGNIMFKEEGIKTIEKFSESSLENEHLVNEWLDEVVKEGIKYSYIKKLRNNETSVMYKSEVFWRKFEQREFKSRNTSNINKAKFSNKIQIFNVKLSNKNSFISKINFTLGLLVYEVKKGLDGGLLLDKIIYPAFVELDLIHNILEVRLKSKSKIYRIRKDEGAFEEKLGNKITTDNMSIEIVKFLKDKLGFEEEELGISKKIFFASYYRLLESLTTTPIEIKNKINCNINMLNKFAEKVFIDLELNTKYIDMAKEDMNIWLEKFISLSESDKNVFMKNRDGYPIKLVATDSDDTRVEETSANREPLQTKPSFFDHKKILQREKLCDGLCLAFKREDTLYYGSQPFLVTMFYKNGFGILKFHEYVEEGDIQNVLSRVIKSL